MTGRNRFIKSIIATVKRDETKLPWTRQAVRQNPVQRRAETDRTTRHKTASA